jgi:V/A-type H+-transporting ATPase subunit I
VAIADFKKVHLVAHRSVQAGLLAALQRLGVVDVSASSVLPVPAAAAADERDLETRLRRVQEAIRLLAHHRAAGARYKGPAPARYTEAELERLAAGFDLEGLLGELDAIRMRKAGAQGEMARFDDEQRRLEPWRNLDVPCDSLQPTRNIAVVTGRVRAADLERYRRAARAVPAVRHRVGAAGRDRSEVLFCLRADEPALRAALAGAGFQPESPPALAVTPAERLAAIERERRAQRESARHEDSLLAYLAGWYLAGWSDELLGLRDLLADRLSRLRAERLLGETRDTVSIEGWVPARLLEATRAAVAGRFALTSFEAFDPAPADRVPVLLANNALTRPFESIVELYGLPRYGGTDPTSVLGFFFALFFGVCITDAGYGILLAIAAGAALAHTPAAAFPERRRLLALFMLGGLATIVVGAAAGGWFGVTVPWKLFDPLQQIMLFFALAILLGAAHLFAGLALRMAQQMRRGQVLAPLLDQGLWITLIAPLLALLGVRAGKLPASLQPALALVALASAFGIVFFHGRGEPQDARRERLHHLLWAGLAATLALYLLGHARPWSGFAAGALGLAEVALLRGRVLAGLGRIGLGL